ncbi:hypothetical protein GJ699_01310 [Duganella sp. FT80W]|uniref:Uncharacterized protein n=1 Tax=Duganella guangzhouensis TaxID=2666084 RepID=A0A6I2KXA7_9BURK|nr:hypothetical protein [Duganella guangzhouensis]MRW88619.1 hypothetical protein [Duganella guangzhouensis]
MDRLRRLALLCCLLPAAAHAQQLEQPQRPIEHFISPPQLFPEEGADRAPYQPFPAYDGPNGKQIGQVVANLNPCAPDKPREQCEQPFSWHLALSNGQKFELPHDMVGYEQEAFVSYQPVRIRAGKAWSRIEYDGGAFWIRTEPEDIINREKRSTDIERFDTWCSLPGKCAPVTAAMRKEIDKVMAGEYAILGAGLQTYSIEGVVTRNGKRYYQVKLAEVEAGKPAPRLPKTGYIPTRDKNGQHVGQFSPKGC